MLGFHVTPDNLVVLILLIITASSLGALIIDYPDAQPATQKRETAPTDSRPVSSI